MPRLSNSFNLINDSAMVRGARKLYNAIRKYAPYKRIKDSVFISRVEGKGDSRFITVGIDLNPVTGAPFARAFDIGSGIHATKGRKNKYKILPKRAPFLQFQGTNEFSGQLIRVKKVSHPGVRGVKYTQRAINDSRQAIRNEIAKDVKQNLRLYLKVKFEHLGK